MFSQFFVLSLRGDTILHKDCKPIHPSSPPLPVRHDLDAINQASNTTTEEMFLSQVGIQNSFSEDTITIAKPFFVSPRSPNPE